MLSKSQILDKEITKIIMTLKKRYPYQVDRMVIAFAAKELIQKHFHYVKDCISCKYDNCTKTEFCQNNPELQDYWDIVRNQKEKQDEYEQNLFDNWHVRTKMYDNAKYNALNYYMDDFACHVANLEGSSFYVKALRDVLEGFYFYNLNKFVKHRNQEF